MLKNYFRIAWQSLKNNKLFSLLNIVGLSIGLAVSILLILFIIDERSFDNMHSNKNNVHRVLLHTAISGKDQTKCASPAAVAPAMIKNIPEVKSAARVLKHSFGATAFLNVNEKNFVEQKFYWCDQELFTIFNIPFIEGNSTTALTRPNTVVISKKIAEKYFTKSALAIGKRIIVDNSTTLEVTGVYSDFAENSSLDCEFIASFLSSGYYDDMSWGNPSFETYCLLTPTASIASVEKMLQQLINDNLAKADQFYTLSLQPFKKVHLYSATYLFTYVSRIGNISLVNNLLLLTGLILLIACINYMNLSTAHAQKRSKETSIHKTLGATKNQMFFRFYAETATITLLAIVIAIILALGSIPLFNQLSGKDFTSMSLFQLPVLVCLFIVWLLCTFLAGLYPALYLSRFSAKLTEKITFHKSNAQFFIRKGLVVVQFTSSVILIIGVTVIHSQVQFINKKNLGYEPENVLAVSTTGIQNKQSLDALVNELNNLPNVVSLCKAQGFPGKKLSGKTLYKNAQDKTGIGIQTNKADSHIFDVLKLKLIAGRTLSAKPYENDSVAEVVLNKSAIEYLGFKPEEAIGRHATIDNITSTIVGVVNDFHFASLHQPLAPYSFGNATREQKKYLLIRFKTTDLLQTMNGFESKFKNLTGAAVFDYLFLDEYLKNQYAVEVQARNISVLFTVLTVLIACLGLFGLAAFTAEQRAKEVGIRKVLGATVAQVTKLLTKDFIALVIISIIIAIPIAWIVMNNWLQNYAYRIELSWWLFATASAIAVVVSVITIGFQTFKAAIANPIKSLRTE